LPNPEQVEYATVLLRRAESDLRACLALAQDPAMADDVVGFHAQQAVEKAIKVVLVLHAIEFPRTHDLSYLGALAREHEVAIPDAMAATAWLTPWGAQLRYDDPSGALDREAAASVAESAIAWARTALGS
jgi:HEPN domain-containing protein